MTCLDDETVLGLVEGRLGAVELSAIDDHLDVCTSCRDVVSHVARARSSVRIDRGQVLGRYVVGDLLGEGAMGRVYSAWEPELDRRVAIKVLQDAAPGARERLLREAQAMARLDHPNVVGVHEVGTAEHGVYVAMDLVDGETLRAWAARTPPWRQVARVLADIARGLAAVHAAGVLHRDVKPDNVIVGADGRARLGDFGLARSGPTTAATPAGDALAIGTPATAVAGTPAYMAPEVLRGAAASEASDQFGFGVMAYEVIAGERPFIGRTWSELARAIDRGSIKRLRRVPGWLDAAIRRCLAVDPARRFPSMTAVAAALEPRRRPVVWIAAAAGAALVASGATWLAVRGSHASSSAPSCELGTTQIASVWNADHRARLDAPTATAVERWTTAWATARDHVCRQSGPPAVIAARERCLDRRRAELAALLARVAPPATPSADVPPGRPAERLVDALAALPPSECTTLALGAADPLPLDRGQAAAIRRIEDELPAMRAAIALGDARPIAAQLATLVDRARASGHAPTLAEALLLEAEAQRAMSNLPAATEAARDAVAAAERGHDDLAAARAWVQRVTIAGDRRELAAAEDAAPIAAAAIDRAGAPKRLVAELLRDRGLVAFNRGRTDDARRLLGEARALYVELAGQRSVEVAAVETSLGAVERAAGDLDAAEAHHRNALAIDRELRGDRHPDLARDLHNLAGIARLRGRLDDALELYHQALQIEDATRGPASVQSALTHNSLGLVLMARGDWARATVEIATARDAFLAAGHGDLAFTWHNLGIIRAAVGEHAQAREDFAKAADAYARTIGLDAAAPIRLHLDRARSEAALGERAAARSDAVRARDLARQAEIAWIADEADALLAGLAPAPKVRVVEPTPAPEPRVVEPTPAPEPPAPAKPTEPPKPQPRKDVGVYGSSQGW